jgi:hypothetical protein
MRAPSYFITSAMPQQAVGPLDSQREVHMLVIGRRLAPSRLDRLDYRQRPRQLGAGLGQIGGYRRRLGALMSRRALLHFGAAANSTALSRSSSCGPRRRNVRAMEKTTSGQSLPVANVSFEEAYPSDLNVLLLPTCQ